MTFEQALAEQMREISQMIDAFYHLELEGSMQALKDSTFYRLLSDEKTGFWQDSAKVNFRRYQNEIEYGAWNKIIN